MPASGPICKSRPGKSQVPVGLERLQSTAELGEGFATQRTPTTTSAPPFTTRSGTPPINYSIGIFNGAADSASDDADGQRRTAKNRRAGCFS